MAILTSTQITAMDLTDQRKLSAYLTANVPKTQVEDPNVLPHTYAPSWAATNLKITPVIFLDQTSVGLGSTGLTITWKRRDGAGSETALTSGESATSSGVLTVSQNKLASAASGMITYICYIAFYDSETGNTVNITSDITFSVIKNAENARLADVVSDTYAFKYNTGGTLVGAAQATLNAQVQGVSIAKWQYKNGSGVWTDYPTTADNSNITSSTLIVKPAHAVFFNNVAQIKLLTDDSAVYDIATITKIYDGSQGATGTGGLSVIMNNEAQSIACTNDGLVATAVDVTIPFVGYIGVSQTACTCTVGALPSGVTTKSNAAATASTAGSVVLTFAANATLGTAATLNGVINLTFTISGKTVVKTFGWTKSVKGNTGGTGANAVAFSVYAPNGTVVQNQTGSLLLATAAYSGSTVITSGATYQWARYTGGAWVNISGASAATLTVSGTDIVNIGSYRCTMTYGGKSFQDVITLEDKSDPYTSEALSFGSPIIKNGKGGFAPYVIARKNQKEVDPLLGPVSSTAPASPATGALWYKVDAANKTVTLMKYSGSAWVAATEKQTLVYRWYKMDKSGNATQFSKTGKVIYVTAEDIDGLSLLRCEVCDV